MSGQTVLTLVLKGDGTGLTGTVHVAEADTRRLGAAFDSVGSKGQAMGLASRRAAGDVATLGAAERAAAADARILAAGANTVRNALGAIGISVLIRDTLQAGLNMDRLERSMAAAVGSQRLAGQELGFVREQAQRLGIYMPTLAQGYVGLAAATRGTVLAGEQTRQIFLAVAESGRAMNLSNEQISGTLTALQQIAGKGTVSMEELRQQLGDRLPGAMQIAARAMDMTVADFVKMVSEGKILASDFLPKFAAELRNAAAAGVELAKNSPAAEFERLRTALFEVAADASRSGALQVLAAGAHVLAANIGGVVTVVGTLVLALAGAFAGRRLAEVTDYTAGVLKARQALVLAASSSVAKAQATATETAATLAALQVSRQQATTELSLANAEIATAQRTIQATQATSFLSASRRTAEIATQQLAAAEARRSAALASLATLGQQQARVELAAASAATQLEAAQVRLNTTQVTAMGVLRGLGSGVASLGSGLLALAGGPIGVVVIGISLLISKFISARAEARRLREEVANALGGVDEAIAAGNRKMMGAAGEHLIVLQQQQRDQISALEKNVADLRFNPIARSNGLYDERQRQLAGLRNELDRTNVALARNRAAIMAGDGALEAGTGATTNATAAAGEFNDQLTKQNEKLKVERIEREQGVRAALEYQAMQAAGVTSVSQLSQATLDLIDTQVKETTAAEAYKQAQKGASDAAREADRVTKAQAESQAQYASALMLARGELQGPLGKAQAEHDLAIQKLDADLAKHNITLTVYNGLVGVEDQKLQSATDELARKQDILGQIRADYADEIRLAGLSGEAYDVEREMIQRRNDALREGTKITPEIEAGWRAEIAWGERQKSVAEEGRRAARDFQDSWLNAVTSVGRALGDWITGTISNLGDLGDALEDIAKRWFSDRFSQGLTRLFNGGFADAGTTGSGGGSWLSQLIGSSQTLQKVASWFGFGGSAATSAGTGWANAYGAGAQLAAGAGVMLPQYGGGTLMGAAAGQAGANYGGSLLSAAGMFKPGTLGKFLTSPAAPWLGAAAGAYYGYNSTDDGTGKVLAGAAYGTAAYGVTAGVGAGLAASAAGAGAGAAASAGLAAIPVVGWIALAAIAVNAISGGKLFGTKYKMESAQTNYTYGDNGIGGRTDVTKVRQKALFGGRKWTTSTQALSDDARAAMDEAFGAIDDAVTQAATQLGISVPNLIGATFTQQFDSKGKLKSEFGSIAGRVYREAQDAFNQRYLAENLLNVAGLAGGHAATVQQLANPYRSSPEALTDFATLMLAIAGDAKAGKLLWDDTDAALQNAVASLKQFQQAGESLAQTYQRVTQGVGAYAQMIAGVRSELLTHGLSQYAQAQVQVELQYRAQVKQANDLAKALGLSGARAEDLASIEQLRAQRMADLQQQMEAQRDQFLGQMRISDLAPGTDQSKLTDAMQQLRDAAGRGDLQAAQQLSQQVLGLGRNLYASGSDYNSLYGTVTGLLNGLDPASSGLSDSALQQMADTLDTLPQDIASALFQTLYGSQGGTLAPPPPTASTPAPGTGSGGSSGTKPPHGPLDPLATEGAVAALVEVASNTRELLRLSKRTDLKAPA